MNTLVGTLIGLFILALIAYYLFVGIWTFFAEFLPLVYKTFRYDRRGICGECKQPFVRELASPADQMYGPDVITQDVCPNGHPSLARGNRRFAEW